MIGPSTTPRWAYGVTKLADEHMAFAYQDEYELPVTSCASSAAMASAST